MKMSEFANNVGKRNEEKDTLLNRLQELCSKDLDQLRSFAIENQWIVWESSEAEALETTAPAL